MWVHRHPCHGQAAVPLSQRLAASLLLDAPQILPAFIKLLDEGPAQPCERAGLRSLPTSAAR